MYQYMCQIDIADYMYQIDIGHVTNFFFLKQSCFSHFQKTKEQRSKQSVLLSFFLWSIRYGKQTIAYVNFNLYLITRMTKKLQVESLETDKRTLLEAFYIRTWTFFPYNKVALYLSYNKKLWILSNFFRTLLEFIC